MSDNKRDLSAAITALQEGKTILYPTDTIWGIGCDATNEEACQEIMSIKARPAEKSFVVLVDSIQMLEKYVPDFAPVCYELIDYADKPLTIVYPTSRMFAPCVIAENGSVAIRVTKDPICVQLIRGLKKPIVSTSANISGEKFPTRFSEVSEPIKEKVGTIVSERLTDVCSEPSQVIAIGLDGSVKILRG